MKHLTPINRKSRRMEAATRAAVKDVVALQQGPPQQPEPHIPHGCSLVFAPGWEADRNGGTAGLCQPVERDLFDCHMGCFWPAQVPDQLNHAPSWDNPSPVNADSVTTGAPLAILAISCAAMTGSAFRSALVSTMTGKAPLSRVATR